MKAVTKTEELLLKNFFVIEKGGIWEPFKDFKHTEGGSDEDGMGSFGFLLLFALLETIADKITLYDNLLGNEEFFKSNVCYMLLNKDDEFLNDMPKREIFDMALVYYLPIKSDVSISALKITNEIAKKIGLTENDLYNLARVNTPKLLPLKRKKEHLAELFNKKLGKDLFHSVISYSNEVGINGAVSVFYENAFENLDIDEDDHLIIMPVSIHGMFVLITKEDLDMNKKKIVGILSEVNKNYLYTEKLSDTIMYYDKDLKEIIEA